MRLKLEKLNRFKIYFLASVAALPLSAYANDNDEKSDSRVEMNYTQRHSLNYDNNSFMADGIKIQRDLSLIDKYNESRILSMDEIPADDLYGGIWVNNRVNAYAGLSHYPDTFKVDLSNFSIPTEGHVTSNFGMRKRRMHYGIDLKVQTGDTIYAAFDGKIRLTQYERKGYGYYIVMRHTNGLETVYGHLSKFLVKEDDVVRSGDPIALGGNTGRSTGSHLHLEFRFLGKPINPSLIVDFDNKVCHRDSYTITSKSFDAVTARNFASAKTVTTPTRTSGNTNKYVSGEVAYHKVKKGDSLFKIAKAYGTTVKNICRLNNISEKTTLRVGQPLRIS